MKTLTQNQLAHVSGGDSWAGTPDGRASVPMPEQCLGIVPAAGFGGIGLRLMAEVWAFLVD